jgi:hypothetical protein
VAQTRKRRRRKHRGTQGGRIDTKRRGRPRSRAEAQQRARSRKRTPKADLPPNWRSATVRGFIISVLLIGTLLLFGRPVPASIAFGVLMLAVYIPMGFWIDRMMWRRRQRGKIKDG